MGREDLALRLFFPVCRQLHDDFTLCCSGKMIVGQNHVECVGHVWIDPTFQSESRQISRRLVCKLVKGMDDGDGQETDSVR